MSLPAATARNARERAGFAFARNVTAQRYSCVSVFVPDGESYLAARLPHHSTRNWCSMPKRIPRVPECPQRHEMTGANLAVDPDGSLHCVECRTLRAANANPCVIDDCPDPVLARGWCRKHYLRWRKYGDTGTPPRFQVKTCSAGDCPEMAEKRGWCDMHYRRWQRTGTTDDPPPKRAAGEPEGRAPKVTACTGSEGCPGQVRYGTLCSTHAERKRLGKPMDAPVRPYIRDREASYWSRVDKNGPVPERRPDLGPCWLWTGNVNPVTGYGQFRQGAPHRYGYELANGAIPEGLHIDHLCAGRHCVNPAHLEAVTQQENNERALRRGERVCECHGRVFMTAQAIGLHLTNERKRALANEGG